MTRRIRISVLSLVAVGLAALALSATASACSCAGVPGKETFRRADAAVVAKLVRVESVGDGLFSDYFYRISESFKRTDRFQPGQTRRIRSATQSATCGLPSREGSTQGLYLYREGGRLTSNLCSVTSAGRIRRTAENVGAATAKLASAGAAPGACSAASA